MPVIPGAGRGIPLRKLYGNTAESLDLRSG